MPMGISLLLPLTIYTFGTRNKFKNPHLCFLFFIVVVVVAKPHLYQIDNGLVIVFYRLFKKVREMRLFCIVSFLANIFFSDR